MPVYIKSVTIIACDGHSTKTSDRSSLYPLGNDLSWIASRNFDKSDKHALVKKNISATENQKPFYAHNTKWVHTSVFASEQNCVLLSIPIHSFGHLFLCYTNRKKIFNEVSMSLFLLYLRMHVQYLLP